MNDLPTIFLKTKSNRLFTVPLPGNPDERSVCLFTTMKAASRFRKRMKPIANKFFPIDLKEHTKPQLFDLWKNWDILWFAVISTDEDILHYRLQFNRSKVVEQIPDAPHRHTGINLGRKR